MGAASSSTAGGVGGNPLLCLGGIDAGNNDAPAPSVKPSFLQVTAGKWAAPWKLVLSPEELAELPEDLRAATLSIRGKISRSNVAYPMPVGAHSVTMSKKFKPRTDDVIITTFHKTGCVQRKKACNLSILWSSYL